RPDFGRRDRRRVLQVPRRMQVLQEVIFRPLFQADFECPDTPSGHLFLHEKMQNFYKNRILELFTPCKT
ncbi:MAG: hypothetical protein J6T54_01935, partial [Fibrobacter sp.]|nr:hypothetical protein [Fibrobacter sp.]